MSWRMASESPQRLDRVGERRRAAQLALHYRDQDGLTVAEIARRLGRAEATVKAYLYDPTGEKARAVKGRYQGVCRGCGRPTAARGGKGDAYRTASVVILARSRRGERGHGRAIGCARGGSCTALRHRQRTGLEHTHADAAPRRSNGCETESRRRQ